MKFATAALAAMLAVPAMAQDRTDPVRDEYAGKLRSLRVTVDFKQAPLEEVVNYLREISGMNMFVGAKVKEKGETQVNLKVSDLPLKSVLNLMLKPLGLTYGYKDGVLLIMTEEEKQSDVIMELYDVRDLLYPIHMFPGVDMSLAPESIGALVTAEEGSAGEEMPIVDLVKAHTGGKTWDDNPKAAINMQNGLLVVKQSREVHLQIRRLISKLRNFK